MIRALLLAAVALVFLSGPAAAAGFERVRTASGKTMEALPGQVIVRYRDGASGPGKTRLSAMGAISRGRIEAINAELVSVPAGQTVTSFVEILRSNPHVLSAEPNGVVRAFAFPADEPNDPLFGNQYALRYSSVTAPANVNAMEAWALTRGSSEVIVAVLDTGVTEAHGDFDPGSFVQGRTIEIDWFNDGDCTDPGTGDLSVVGPDQCESNDPTDNNNQPTVVFHGTRVAGLIGASANNNNDIAGLAPDCRIMGVKVLNSHGFGSFFSIAEGIVWAADNNADVMNLSLGGAEADPSGATQTAINYALSKNVVIVAASGNSGNSQSVAFPAAYPGVIAVGSIGATNLLSAFSQTGKTLDVVAPGENIFASQPASAATAKNGTSFSGPYVAATAALIRAVRPDLSWQDVTKYITFTATDLGPGGFDTGFGFGRLNAGRAVTAAANNEIFVSNPAEPGETFPYPNPFRPATGQTVTLSLPASLGSEGIEIDILNIAGEKIKTLNGTTVWDGRNDDGSYAASGLYFYRAKTARGDANGKLTLIK